MNKFTIILFLFFLIFISCDKEKDKNEYLAKFENSTLSDKNLQERFDSTFINDHGIKKEYIKEWVRSNVLFKEAEEKGITSSKEFEDLLFDAKKNIAINLFLQKAVYEKVCDIPESEILEYYRLNKNQFLLGNDLINISFIVFNSYEPSQYFFNMLKNYSWNESKNKLFDLSYSRNIKTSQDSVIYKYPELSPPEIWKIAVSLNSNEISTPVKVLNGYLVLKLNDKQKAGEIGNLNFVKKEIVERLKIDRRRKLYQELISDLFKKYNIELNNE